MCVCACLSTDSTEWHPLCKTQTLEITWSVYSPGSKLTSMLLIEERGSGQPHSEDFTMYYVESLPHYHTTHLLKKDTVIKNDQSKIRVQEIIMQPVFYAVCLPCLWKHGKKQWCKLWDYCRIVLCSEVTKLTLAACGRIKRSGFSRAKVSPSFALFMFRGATSACASSIMRMRSGRGLFTRL